MAKKIIKGFESQSRIVEGVVDAVSAIETTIGPSGRCVAIENIHIGPEITRDGATVAKSITFKDGAKNIGAQLVRKAAELTESFAGDATSTTSVLIKEFCQVGQKVLRNGDCNVNELKSGMLKAQNWVKEYIAKNAISVDGDLEKIRRVATISANNDPVVGDLIVDSMKKVGINGIITADLSSSLETVVDVTPGMKIERGWSNPNYATDEAEGKCVLEDCFVLVCGTKLSNFQQLRAFIESLQPDPKPVLMVCDGIDENVNATLLINTMRGMFRVCVVKDIDFGDGRKNQMQDIATKTGATYFCPENGKDIINMTPEDFGHAKKVIVTSDSTIIFEGDGNPDEIKARASILMSKIEDPAISDYNKTKFSKRLANLVGGIGVIKAGGATEVEKVNRKATIEDAILASKSAIEEGCLAGGGYTYFKASIEIMKDKAFWGELTDSECEGAMIVVKSLPVVLKTIVSNSGASVDVVLNEMTRSIRKENFGFNAKKNEYCNLLEDGILDSAKAVRVALEHSVSTASMILSTDCLLLEEEETKAAATPSL